MLRAFKHPQFSYILSEFDKIASEFSDCDLIRHLSNTKTAIGICGEYNEAFFKLYDWISPPVLEKSILVLLLFFLTH